MIWERWKGLPEWKKKLYKMKKKGEKVAMKTVYKVATKGGRMIGKLGRPCRSDDDGEDDSSEYF
jgi:hypothetical protein